MKIVLKRDFGECLRHGFFLFLVGAVILAVGCFLITGPQPERRETEAVISRIEEHGDEHAVYVDYAVKGHGYLGVELGSYNSKMRVGDTVTIEYEVDDPTSIRSTDAEIILFIFMIAGLGIAAAGAWQLKRYIRRRQEYDAKDPDEDKVI